MRGRCWWGLVAFVLFAAVASAQQPANAPVPPLAKFSGVAPGAVGAVPVILSLYSEQEGGAPLWSEAQTVIVDASGRYSAMLGAQTPGGLPAALFASGEPRWVGVAIDGKAEFPRTLLTSVPYALKAADATTIGGKPLSAFVLAGDKTGVGADGLLYVDKTVLGQALSGTLAPTGGAFPTTSGSTGYIGKFTSASDLGNSLIYETAGKIGINNTAPESYFHSTAASAPGAFFDVIGSLGALPVVNRAARGTPGAPTAVQADDILGGLAVRGHDGSAWSQGQGQVMFKAAAAWTASSHPTYLQLTTTPVNSTSAALERLRITPEGYVGVATSAPTHPLEVTGGSPSLYASGGGGLLLGGKTAIMGHGTGSICFLGSCFGGTGVEGDDASGHGVGVYGHVSGDGTGVLAAAGPSGTAISAEVDGTTVMNVNATGVHAGPGLTPTPIAHGFFSSDGSKHTGSSNITCAWVAASTWYACTIAGEDYMYNDYTAIVTAASSGSVVVPTTGSVSGQLLIEFHTLGNTQVQASAGFGVVVFKQ